MNKNQVHIVGGGVIGLCSAWYLTKEGWDVTVVDKNNLTDGTSFGNAGMVVPSHFIPLATPGVIWKGIKWMLNKKSPFAITTKVNTELLSWLWHFQKSSTRQKVAAAAEILKDYNTLSRDLYQAMAYEENMDFAFERKGLLMVYQDRKTEQEEIEVAEKANFLGLEARILSDTDLAAIEKNVSINARGAVYYPSDAHLVPRIFLENLTAKLRQKGVHFMTNAQVTNFSLNNNKVSSLQLSNGHNERVHHVVISAGSWSNALTKLLGTSLLLQPGKGYSLTLHKPKVFPSIPTILTEAKVAITPMLEHLRVGGTMEIGNRSSAISSKRVAGILESLPRYYPEFNIKDLKNENVWHGFRPCTPDGLPYLGKVNNLNNVVVATGHAMMGMSLGPATGKIVSEILANDKSSLDLSLFKVHRF